ncbi:hypothetical protein KCU65_g8101, partial [Aureobasidium melanogenum]
MPPERRAGDENASGSEGNSDFSPAPSKRARVSEKSASHALESLLALSHEDFAKHAFDLQAQLSALQQSGSGANSGEFWSEEKIAERVKKTRDKGSTKWSYTGIVPHEDVFYKLFGFEKPWKQKKIDMADFENSIDHISASLRLFIMTRSGGWLFVFGPLDARALIDGSRGSIMKRPLLYSMFLMLFFLCSRVSSSGTAEYGVGFNLALDYGTASIWYANGTAVDIVKLDGGFAYKQIMRSASAEPYKLVSPTGPTQGLLGFTFFQDYLPSWAAAEPVYHEAEAVTWMLKGLKGATEAYVEEPLADVLISSPFHIPDQGWLDNTLRTSVESLGLRYLGTRRASTFITGIYGLEGQCHEDPYATPDQRESDDPPKLYLALDYSSAGISVALVEEDCGIAGTLREFRNATLGAGNDFPGKREYLTRQLKDLLRPIDRWYPEIGDYQVSVETSELVLLGESTEDALLHEVLLEVFGSDYNNLKSQSDKRARLHHPLFAGSRAVAEICQKRLEVEMTMDWDEQFQGWVPKDPQREGQKWWWPFKRDIEKSGTAGRMCCPSHI